MALIATTAMAACVPDVRDVVSGPSYGAVNTRLLEGDLVAIDVTMKNASAEADVIAFNDCAAAQYALIRGASFVRRVTNDVTRRGRTWRGAGVYTLSDAFPGGAFTIDAGVTAAACKAANIPTV